MPKAPRNNKRNSKGHPTGGGLRLPKPHQTRSETHKWGFPLKELPLGPKKKPEPPLPVPAVLFHRFRDLPPELRDEIWKFVACQPRVIEVLMDERPGIGDEKFASKTLVPGMLHTNHEARTIGLKLYSKLPPYGDRRCYGDTFVRWDYDIIMFQSIEVLVAMLLAAKKFKEAGTLEKVHEVAAKCQTLLLYTADELQMLYAEKDIYPLKALRKLMYVVGPPPEQGTGNLVLQMCQMTFGGNRWNGRRR